LITSNLKPRGFAISTFASAGGSPTLHALRVLIICREPFTINSRDCLRAQARHGSRSAAREVLVDVLLAPSRIEATATLEVLADALQAGGHSVPECLGPSATATAFAELWGRRTGRGFTLKMAQRVYELRQVHFPVGVPGKARVPTDADLDLLADWTHRFGLEVSAGEPGDPHAARASVQELMGVGRKLIWEDQGRPVSMAAAQRPLKRGIAISRVYTPPEHRGHGYASACVATLSQRQLDAGRQFCCLYTDLANPTSNSIYQKIGYVPVADSSHFVFTPAPACSSEAGR
jgi:predicted GNAT family acetyltransferase